MCPEGGPVKRLLTPAVRRKAWPVARQELDSASEVPADTHRDTQPRSQIHSPKAGYAGASGQAGGLGLGEEEYRDRRPAVLLRQECFVMNHSCSWPRRPRKRSWGARSALDLGAPVFSLRCQASARTIGLGYSFDSGLVLLGCLRSSKEQEKYYTDMKLN